MIARTFKSITARPVLFLLCALFFSLGILRLNTLSLYNPDSTRYLIWGNSIAHGRGYVDNTQTDADRYVIHAPLYAFLIAPAEIFSPLSTVAAKIETLIWGIGMVILFFLWLEKMFGKIQALAGTILLICNPLLLIYSTEVLSEVPFVAAGLLVFYLYEKLSEMGATKKGKVFFFILLCLPSIALLREVGIALVGAAVIFHFVRRQPRSALAITGVSLLILGVWYVRNQIIVTPTPGSQTGNLSLITEHFVSSGNDPIYKEFLFRIWLQARAYIFQLGGMLLYPQYATQQVSLVLDNSALFTTLESMFNVGQYFVIVILVPLLGFGLYEDLQKSRTALLRLLFVGFYLLGIFLYPIHDLRFIFPLLPLGIFYILRSIHRIFLKESAEPGVRKQRILIVVAIVIMAPNILGIQQLLETNLDYLKSPIAFHLKISRLRDYPPMFAQPWSMLGAWIRAHTPEEVVIASPAKEIATMVGRRKILEMDPGITLPEFEKVLRDNQIKYLIAPVRWGDFRVYEFMMNESKRFWFEPVYVVAKLQVMKIHSRFLDTLQPDEAMISTVDTLTPGGFLRMGRMQIMAGDYGNAIRSLSGALQLSPLQPEIIFQDAVANAFGGDTATALARFQRLLTLPQAGSFLYATRLHLHALELLAEARMSKSGESAEVESFEAASVYWTLGYPHRAGELMDSCYREGSHHFVGLLWGFHFAHQRGDTSTMAGYLGRLREIDATNIIVKTFDKLIAFDDSLKHPVVSTAKVRMYLGKARLYRQIELFEEAIDEAERSLHEDKHNLAAMNFLAEEFCRRKSLRAALNYYDELSRLLPDDSTISVKADSLRLQLSAF